MNKVKRSLVLLLVGALLFSFITVLSSASVTIPQGPIDSVNRDNGINQIMEAGVEDINFATAIYDALVEEGYFGDESKNVREILGEFDGSIDASNRGIESIYGIEWLINARSIDLSNREDSPNPDIKNSITDLTPITIDYIMSIADLPSVFADEPVWFRNRRNLKIDLSGNPIQKYGDSVGRLDLTFGAEQPPEISTDNLVAIKENGENNWSVTKNITLPTLEGNGEEVKFSDGFRSDSETIHITRIEYNTMNRDASINYSELENRNLQIMNIKQSGIIYASLGIDRDNGVFYYKNTPIGDVSNRLDPDSITFNYMTNFTSRIYTPVKAEKDVKVDIKVSKSATCDYSGKKVVGAKYYLYDASTNERVSDKEYITDDNGEFWIDDTLPVGEYYLLEFEAPEGYLINESKISFNVIADEREITVSGGDKDLNVNAGTIEEDPDTVYIDRYSNSVEVNISDDSNYALDHLEVTYFDRETQAYKTITGPQDGVTFTTAQEIADWINSNKGNDNAPGIIDGEVKIKAFFVYHKELLTSDPRPVTTVEFTKNGSGLDDNGEIIQTPLANATFKLECTHKHTEHCKDANGGYSQCTDPHTDCGDFLTDEGCSWSTEVTSGEDGKVVFENVNTGTYKMTEVVVPDGYLVPETTWTVVVDASKNTFEISVDNDKNDNLISGDQSEGYTIINESFNVKVKKIDSESGKVLKGASFELFKLDEQEQWVSQGTATTGDNGLAYFKKLSEGQYMIREIEAPPGYELITDVIEFSVPFEYDTTDINGIESTFSDDTKVVTFTVSDKVGVNLPNTGATLTARIASLGIVIMGFMAILIKKLNNKKN
ncbi:MSCRAMM family protein [Thomasclavelia saccharogumia]|uniref:MSCRAMM family protein n=1 Tax=Thomasclavelia saccharogumia TaxID=341225 RepID=UPI00068C14AB|nr:SpaA isopeptide-forming pilin-related protein [Thomasclavelia saccharogumia]